jgi:hypothetical protein
MPFELARRAGQMLLAVNSTGKKTYLLHYRANERKVSHLRQSSETRSAGPSLCQGCATFVAYSRVSGLLGSWPMSLM